MTPEITTPLEELATALSYFLGRPVEAGTLLSLYQVSVVDEHSEMAISVNLNLEEGEYMLSISNYFSDHKDLSCATTDYKEFTEKVLKLAEIIRSYKDGVNRLTALYNKVEDASKDIGLDTKFNYYTSFYLISYNNVNETYNDPNKAADRIEGILLNNYNRYIDRMNILLTEVGAPVLKWEESYEFYDEGFFFSVFYYPTGFVVTYHPTADPGTWVQEKGRTLPDFNKVLARVSER